MAVDSPPGRPLLRLVAKCGDESPVVQEETERVDDGRADHVGRGQRRGRRPFGTHHCDSDGGCVEHERVVRPVPDRDTHVGSELSDEARLVVSRRDRLWLQAELLATDPRVPNVSAESTCTSSIVEICASRSRDAVDEHAAIGERPVDVEDEVLQRE